MNMRSCIFNPINNINISSLIFNALILNVLILNSLMLPSLTEDFYTYILPENATCGSS